MFFRLTPRRAAVYRLNMVRTSHRVRLLTTLALLLPILCSCGSPNAINPALVGHWEGNGRIIVSWCHQKNLAAKVDIHPDGSVSGTVGDARLTEGRFLKNRGWLGRKLNIETDYIITGNLNGPIVAAEGITRQRVMMPCNFEDGLIKGAVDTDGSLCVFSSEKTRKAKMVFTAGLRLTHLQ